VLSSFVKTDVISVFAVKQGESVLVDMSTLRYQFRSRVHDVTEICSDFKLLIQAKIAFHRGSLESTSSSDDFPRYGWVLVLAFEFPILFGKFCFIFVTLVIERLLVVAESFFERSFSETDVVYWHGIVIGVIIDRYRGFIDRIFGETFSFQRALVFHDTVTCRDILVVGRLVDTFIVAIDE